MNEREGSHRGFINHFSWHARDLGQMYKVDILEVIAVYGEIYGEV